MSQRLEIGVPPPSAAEAERGSTRGGDGLRGPSPVGLWSARAWTGHHRQVIPARAARAAVADFGGLAIEYDDRVLRPRSWVQLQSEWAVELLADAPDGPVLELCAGAGHIGLLVAARTGRRLVAVDLNPAACAFTGRNARRAGLEQLVEVREGRLEDAVVEDETYALVVADPPWVTTEAVGRYPEDPLLAIDGGVDGLAVARACLEASAGHLVAGGSVLLQLGDAAQADEILAWAGERGWADGGRRLGERGLVLRLVAAVPV